MPTYYFDPAKTGPTYRKSVWIRNIYGAMTEVTPNETQTSDTFYDTTNDFPELTQTSEAPYFNPWLAVTAISGNTTHTLNAATKTVLISRISGTGTLGLQSASNTPLTALSANVPDFQIRVDGRFQKLVFTETSALACTVYETAEEGDLV